MVGFVWTRWTDTEWINVVKEKVSVCLFYSEPTKQILIDITVLEHFILSAQKIHFMGAKEEREKILFVCFLKYISVVQLLY